MTTKKTAVQWGHTGLPERDGDAGACYVSMRIIPPETPPVNCHFSSAVSALLDQANANLERHMDAADWHIATAGRHLDASEQHIRQARRAQRIRRALEGMIPDGT